MTELLTDAVQISDHSTERALVAMVALAPELWPDVGYLAPESFGLLRCASAWAKLGDTIRAGNYPDPREYGEFIGFDPPPILRDFAVDYATTISRNAYCRAAVRHCSDVARLAFARDDEGLAALLACPPKFNGHASTLETMQAVGDRGWDAIADPRAFHLRCFSTGLRGWDAICGEGNEPGTLSVLMARPGMGKTASLVQMSDAMSEAGRIVAIFSKEMTSEQWHRRMACRRARVSWFRYKRGDIPEDDLKLVQEWFLALMKRSTLRIDDTTPQTTGQVTAECERLKEQFGKIDFVLCDHLRLFGDKADNETHRLGKISWGFKMLAKRLNTRVICAAQLSRAVEARSDKVPDLVDLRDSGEIEENADNVIALYRRQYYDKDADSRVEFHARKVRDGERGNVGIMDWEAAYQNFREMKHDEIENRGNGNDNGHERKDTESFIKTKSFPGKFRG